MLRKPLYLIALSLFLSLPLGILSGCGGGQNNHGGGTPTPVSPTPAKQIYVIQNNVFPLVGDLDPTASDTILTFAATGNGESSPQTTLLAPSGYYISAIATDSSGNLYIAGSDLKTSPITSASIFVYPAGTSGNATPIRTIQGAATLLNSSIFGMTVDSTGELYVSLFQPGTGYGAIQIFAPGANGNVAPERSISGDAAQMMLPGSLAVNASKEIYVSDYSQGKIFVFAAGASGNAAPTRTISGSATGFAYIDPLTLDSDGNLYVAAEDSTQKFGVINVFSPTANGNATPIRSIGGAKLGAASGVGCLQIDATGTIYAVSFAGPGNLQSPQIVSFDSSATGDVAPNSRAVSTAYTSSPAFGAIAIQ